MLILRMIWLRRDEEERTVLSLPLQNLKTLSYIQINIDAIRKCLGFIYICVCVCVCVCELTTLVFVVSYEKLSFKSSFFYFYFFFPLIPGFRNLNNYCPSPTTLFFFFEEAVISNVVEVLHFYELCSFSVHVWKGMYGTSGWMYNLFSQNWCISFFQNCLLFLTVCLSSKLNFIPITFTFLSKVKILQKCAEVQYNFYSLSAQIIHLRKLSLEASIFD